MPQKGVQTHCIQTPSLFSPRLLQESEAPSITSSFDGLKAHAARAAAENAEPKTGGKLTTKNAVQKFLDSLLQKSGKLRGLIRELDDCYANSSVMQTNAKKYEKKSTADPSDQGGQKAPKGKNKVSKAAGMCERAAMTCRSAIRVAQGVVRDVGASASKSSGLADLARCTETNSERDMNVLTRRYKLCLPVEMSVINKTPGVRYTGEFNMLKLTAWIRFHLEYNTWHLLVGLRTPNPKRERNILSEWWKRYRLLRPEHEVFRIIDEQNLDTSRMVPALFHGDEGRGKKRAAFLVCAIHSYLGFGTLLSNKTQKSRPFLRMRLNYAGNSHISRMLVAVLPKMLKDEIAFQDLMAAITQDCLDMLLNGIVSPHDGQTYRVAVLQVCGDWMFLQKAGGLARSYANCQKRPWAENAIPRGICHLCKAGQSNVPFEDLLVTARWRSTMHDPTDSPFIGQPVLLRLPHDRARPAGLFAFDLWHAWHLGVGKTFSASVLCMIAMQMPASNVEDRFSLLTRKYLEFCDSAHETPYILQLTHIGLGWPDTKTYPNAQWSKGHITTLMMKFLEDYFNRHPCDASVDPLFPKCREAVIAMNRFMEQLYSSELWIASDVALPLARLGEKFLSLYMDLAYEAFHAGRHHFVFMPKAHILSHVIETMMTDCQSGAPYVLNPLTHAVQVDEDFVGKVSRVSRRVGVGQVIQRALQRTLMASWKHYIANGFIRAS
ncbi:unnamed protein product [Durusdinium trenchii]|uniref:Uncharacterized protein n=1 Tax=Durusdinium trenchii TaxID=1381693 RepID=A0ABP0NQ02_9DINO